MIINNLEVILIIKSNLYMYLSLKYKELYINELERDKL